ncbi:MAG TPA: S4 domain-containing protein YaaA [Bacillota bacterium]|nr:S4 domain-containing protein YaaA [Bacillota bacterium]
MSTNITIQTEYITLGQFLKVADIISTGGQAKGFLAEAKILVNGQEDNRRGRKLYPDDQIEVNGSDLFVISRR